jgi:hypothetical protein
LPVPEKPEGGWESREQMDREYAKFGWSKEIVFDWIEVNSRRGVVEIRTKRFDSNMLRCGKPACDRLRVMYVMLAPHGPIQTCGNCRHTMGILPDEDGIIENVRTATSKAEVDKILRKTGQVPPLGIERMLPTPRGSLFRNP